MIGTCQYCGTKEKDLRPYGRNGESICFQCGMKDENIKDTERMFLNRLGNGPLIIVEVDNIHYRKCSHEGVSAEGYWTV